MAIAPQSRDSLDTEHELAKAVSIHMSMHMAMHMSKHMSKNIRHPVTQTPSASSPKQSLFTCLCTCPYTWVYTCLNTHGIPVWHLRDECELAKARTGGKTPREHDGAMPIAFANLSTRHSFFHIPH